MQNLKGHSRVSSRLLVFFNWFSTEQTNSRHNMLVAYYSVAEGLSAIIYNNKRTRNFLAQLRISGVMSYEYGTVKCLYVICIY